MTKSELILAIAKKHTGLGEKVIVVAINDLIEQMSKALCSGGRIEIRGFGSFSLHYHAPRHAHNPRTGDKIMTEAKYTPHFKPGKELKDRVNAAHDRDT